MKGYVYKMFAGADPDLGWEMTDPILSKTPTLGACVPNIRRVVVPGDFIFAISGRMRGVQQYVVGGFQVSEKIDALTALARFPENKQRQMPDGSLVGNIIVNADGSRSAVDYHTNFGNRISNYIVGTNAIALQTHAEVAQARVETVPVLGRILGVRSQSLNEIVARWRRLDHKQIDNLLEWLEEVKRSNRGKP